MHGIADAEQTTGDDTDGSAPASQPRRTRRPDEGTIRPTAWGLIAPLALLVLAGFALRLWISWHSLGTNDWEAWAHFGYWIGEHGLFDMYRADPHLNHPPLAALWARYAMRWSQLSGLPFPFLLRFPALVGDALACALLGLIWAKRRGAVAGWGVAALFAWSLPAVLVGAYHCNTDTLCAALALLSAYLLAERRGFLAGGLALAAAINVKLIPVLLILPLLSLCRDRRDAARFLAGLAVGALPFLPVLIGAGRAFYRNALSYNPMVDQWGVALFLQAFAEWKFPPPASWPGWRLQLNQYRLDALNWYHAHAKYVIAALTAALAAASWLRRRQALEGDGTWDAYDLAALTIGFFLLLTGGFGVQYVVYAAPLLYATRRNLVTATVYNLLAGLFLLTVYAHWWTGTFPPYSAFGGPAEMPAPLFGLLAWWALLVFVCRTVFRRGATIAAGARIDADGEP